MFIDQPLRGYFDQLASEQPVPGGGSAAALSGALAAGLASMVARLTARKPAFADVQEEIEGILQQSEQLRDLFQQLIQEDSDAYSRLLAVFKMPRGTQEEKTARAQAVQGALEQAALVPLDVAECTATLLRYCQRLAEIGNATVLSDIAVAASLATAAGTGAAWMVRTNIKSMKDMGTAEALSSSLGIALDEIMERSQLVASIVGERT